MANTHQPIANTVLCEVVWLVSLLINDFKIPLLRTVLLYCYSQGALYIAADLVFHERIKHIQIDCHFIRETIQS